MNYANMALAFAGACALGIALLVALAGKRGDRGEERDLSKIEFWYAIERRQKEEEE